jgi:hypothetical protein
MINWAAADRATREAQPPFPPTQHPHQPAMAYLLRMGQQRVQTILKSSTTADEIPNPTPGEILLVDFLRPISLTQPV